MLDRDMIASDLSAIFTDCGELAVYNGETDVIVAGWHAQGMADVGEFVRDVAECSVRVAEVDGLVRGSSTITYDDEVWTVTDYSSTSGLLCRLVLTRDVGGQL